MDSKDEVITSDRSPINQKYYKCPGEYFDEVHNVLWNDSTPKESLKAVQQFEFRSEDIILATYAKSGTTLMQEVLWLIENNADTKKAREIPITTRVPYLEMVKHDPNQIEKLAMRSRDSKRLIKTHLPLRYIAANLEKGQPRVIQIIRNPKDTMTSFFHFYRGMSSFGPFTGDWNEFFEMWMDGHIVGGDWFDVVPEWWKATQKQKFPHLVVFYENYLRNPAEQVQIISNFCGVQLDTEQIKRIVEHSKFNNMRDNPSTNYSNLTTPSFQFMRKGQIGDWKNHFSSEQSRRFDEAMKLRLADCEQLQLNLIYE